MFILKNSITSIIRNKGRNILIGIIILVIACASTVTLSIRNTGNKIVKEYNESNDIIGSISFDRRSLAENFKGGEDAKKENIEAFNNIEQTTLENIVSYADSNYLKGYYYIYATSLNSNQITKATDTYEYEVEDKKTSTSTTSKVTGNNNNSGNFPGRPPGGFNRETHTNTTITITKTMEKFQSSRNLTGDFELDGYSSYDAMTEFKNGDFRIESGEMISSFEELECVINSELATLNELNVGDTIKLVNPNNKKEYEFKIVGIYKDNTNQEDVQNMYSSSANKIITGDKVIEKLVSEDEKLVTNITPSFIIKDEKSIELFENEVKSKGLNEYYSITTNIEELKNATKSISNVSNFATTFLVITLIISGIVLFVINMINIRERKYEIGVFRTIGLSKFKLSLQFICELLIITIIFLTIGMTAGAFASKPVGNKLLENEIVEMNNSNNEVDRNFGRQNMEIRFNRGVQLKQIDSINAVVDYKVIIELFGIGILLTFISSIASMISIQRFSPLTILKERS